MALQRTKDAFSAFKIQEYRNLLAGRLCFTMAYRMMGTLVGWWIYTLTNSPFAIGLIGLSEVIPALSLALYSGHVIDQSEKRVLLLKGVIAYLLIGLTLLFLSTSYTSSKLTNTQISYCIYAAVFCSGIARTFTGPTISSMLFAIVPRQSLAKATTGMQGTFLIASVTGHAMGGLFIALLGNLGTLIVIISLMVTAWIFFFRLKPKPAIEHKGEKKTWESVKEGLRFVFKTKELLGAMALDMVAVLFGGAVAMVPVFARDILKVGPLGFGWLNAAVDIGAIFTVILLTIFPLQKAQGKKLLLAVAGFGVCIILFGFSKWFALSFVALMLAGTMDAVSMVVRGTVMQLKTPDNMRGRVSSVSTMFVTSSNELGQFESGVMSRLLGVVPSVIFGGTMTVAVALFTWFKAPKLRKFEY